MRRELLAHSQPFEQPEDLASLISEIKDKDTVMLGESSHGTQEFYSWRRRISQILIEHYGFNFIAVEGDWPPCEEVNCWVRGKREQTGRGMALSHFTRWPTWMWANTEVQSLVEWMKDLNQSRTEEEQIGFHGLDVYSFFDSMDEVLRILEKVDPALARKAKNHYACFDPYLADEKLYARSLLSVPAGCHEHVTKVLTELLSKRVDSKDANQAFLFDARQNARIVRNAENYYRSMVSADDQSWNIRDRHMMETLQILHGQYGKNGKPAKSIIWAHNTHIGDYRFTSMLAQGQVNLGGLAREKFGDEKVALVGFGTYAGTVIASPEWEGPVETMIVPRAKSDSVEDQYHAVAQSCGSHNLITLFNEKNRKGPLAEVHGHRAIGVVYHPEYEQWGNYVPTSLAHRYDAFLFLDKTRALQPLGLKPDPNKMPDTYPAGR